MGADEKKEAVYSKLNPILIYTTREEKARNEVEVAKVASHRATNAYLALDYVA